jgi:tricorn protease-like protein
MFKVRVPLSSLMVCLAVLGASVVSVSADDTFKAEYVSGKAGFDKKIKGQLLISEQALVMMDGTKVIFTIPLTTVMKATDTVENNSGGFGRKLMFGNFSNRSEGFVFVTTETADAAEAIVFKVAQKAPAGIVAKIQFAAKKAKGGLPPTQ